jgi:benzaldehyde dehydrogenase (NAD)
MTGDHSYDCSSAGLEDYKIAIESAQAAFKSWSRTPPSSRRLSFLKAADIVGTYLTEGGEVNAKEILSCEVSGAKMWTLRNIESAAAVLRESAGLVTHIRGEVVPADRPGTTILVTERSCWSCFCYQPLEFSGGSDSCGDNSAYICSRSHSQEEQ